MVMIALCSSLIGAILAARFKALVLLPAIAAGVALVIAAATMKGSTMSVAVTATAVWVIFLQIGYLSGLLTRLCLQVTGLAPQRSLHSTIARN